MIVEAATAELALLVFNELEPDDRQTLSRLMAERLKKPASLEQILEQGRQVMKVVVGELVEAHVASIRDVMEARVHELVQKKWEAEVESIVRARVDAALSKVKAEMVR